jgi:hypothetical protein
MINTLQLAARKNRPGTIPGIITDDCNLIDVPLCEGHLKT